MGRQTQADFIMETVEKGPAERRKRWKGNIKMGLRETGCEDGKWMELAYNRGQWQALILFSSDYETQPTLEKLV
jgi:hypothetical protein